MVQATGYPSAGEVIDGKYRIDRMLGQGGMGAVAAAFHLLRKAPVALKFISPDIVRVPGAVERFVNEAVAASQIDSDHVVRIFDVGQMPSGLPYIVMEMMSGQDLAVVLEREGPTGLPVPRAVHFVLQILRALQVAHGAGIIHRDLKPSNAFVITKDGEPDFVKLLDFGISKITQDASESAQHLTQTNTGLGTPLYMSPEQARNARDATPRSDIYSVSAILYELLTARTPYLADTPNDLLFKLFTTEPDDIRGVRPDVPEGLAAAIHRGLSKEPAGRPASVTELAELIAPYADARSASIVSKLGPSRSSLVSSDPQATVIAPSGPLDRTAIASSTVGARTVPAAQGGGATELNMGVSDAPGGAAQKKKSNAGVLAAVGVVAVLALAGGGVALSRGSATPAATTPTAPSAKPAPSPTPDPAPAASAAKSAAPEVAPVVDAPPAATSATGAKKPAGAAAPPAAPGAPPATPAGKKSPFSAGIMQ
ncbi:MAG: serine/threonine protein kinase [Polyangiaceae bacterium]|nr:serine/threonine protein kinase [Polyangiaceae bacterium]